MTGASLFHSLWRDERGAAAEFALVVPLLLLFVLGALDAGFYMWHVNQAEKATQIGARVAVVTNPVASAISTESYVNKVVGGTTVALGDRVPVGAFGKMTCTNAACTCDTGPCPATTHDSAAFNTILARMRGLYPSITASDVSIEYSGSGLGFAGDPNGPDIAPIVTVRVTGLEYSPFSGAIFGAAVDMPPFSYSLTAEDSSGTRSN